MKPIFRAVALAALGFSPVAAAAEGAAPAPSDPTVWSAFTAEAIAKTIIQ